MIATLDHREYPLDELLARKDKPVSVVLPARDCAATVGEVAGRVLALDGLADQVLVVDASSSDGTAEAAAAAGAEVVDEAELAPELGPVLGKGDAMWRALRAVRGDVVAFVDADTTGFDAGFVRGLVGPLLTTPELRFVKGTYRRPFTAADGAETPSGGGRVSQLVARPLLEAFFPELAGFTQPLAGEVAATRELLESIPFATGYGVEMAMLLDVAEAAGVGAMAQCDLGERRNAHQPLDALRPMAETVLAVVCARRGIESAGPEVVTRPALAAR